MPLPINPDYPIQSIQSVDDLMDIAVAMESEAASRYEQLARRIEGRGQPDLVELFRQLAQLEREHESGLAAWARREGRRQPVSPQFAWRLPETFGDEADERPLDPYQALAIAVRNEERAFAFYTYLAAMCAGREELSARAESLAREELKHVSLLRGLRRSAFHAREVAPSRYQVEGVVELGRLAGGLEAGSAEVDGLAAQTLAGTAAEIALNRCRVDDLRLANAAAGPFSDTVEGARRAGLLVPGALTAAGVLALALRNAQEVLDVYLTIADGADDQDLLAEAQRLAEHAMARLALIRSLMAD